MATRPHRGAHQRRSGVDARPRHWHDGVMSRPTWQWSAAEITRAVSRRELSARAVALAALERLDAVNARTNAVVVTLREAALADADALDRSLARGERPPILAGVPVTVKDNIDQAGLANVNGVAALKTVVATSDHPVVRHWRDAGAIILGRTNTPAFSFRYDTNNDVYGRTWNPRDRERTVGGSSGGAAAAVATGASTLAHGNDYGGSIRYPAFCCGTLGLRPTMGRVPTFNGTATTERPPTAQVMSVQGLLGRHVKDLRIGLAAMAKFDARDPWWVPAPLEGPPLATPVRVAMTLGGQRSRVHRDVEAAVRAAATALASAGYEVDEIEPPNLERIDELFLLLVLAEVRELFAADMTKMGDAELARAIALNLDVTRPLTLPEYMTALAERARYLREWLVFMERYPLVLTPVSLAPPFRLGFDCTTPEAHGASGAAQRPLRVVNVLGLPALTVPVGLTAGDESTPAGLPLGVQLIASRYREDTLFSAAEALEASFGAGRVIDPC